MYNRTPVLKLGFGNQQILNREEAWLECVLALKGKAVLALAILLLHASRTNMSRQLLRIPKEEMKNLGFKISSIRKAVRLLEVEDFIEVNRHPDEYTTVNIVLH